MKLDHLVDASHAAATPLGSPIITSCGKVIPHKPGDGKRPVCPKCVRNVTAVGGGLVPNPRAETS